MKTSAIIHENKRFVYERNYDGYVTKYSKIKKGLYLRTLAHHDALTVLVSNDEDGRQYITRIKGRFDSYKKDMCFTELFGGKIIKVTSSI